MEGLKTEEGEMMEHTKTKLHVESDTVSFVLKDENDNIVAGTFRKTTQEEEKANAEFIALTWNNHDKLVKALKICLKELQGDQTDDDWETTIKQAEQALKQAKE